MSTATVVELWRHPVKSMQGEALTTGEFDERGLAGDRRWGVRDVESGLVLSAKREGRLLEASAVTVDGTPRLTLPSGDTYAADDEGVHAALSAWLGRSVRLDRADTTGGAAYQMNVAGDDESSPLFELPCPPGTFLDAAGVHILTTASLRAAAAIYPEGQWDVRRFRPTILVEVDEDGFVEDEWVGSTLRIGTLAAMVFAPTVRCAMPTRAQPGGVTRDVDILRTVQREHGSNLGAYAAIQTHGTVTVGDAVVVGEG